MYGLQLTARRIADDREVEWRLENSEVKRPGPDEVVVRVDAAPIHPTDMFSMFGFTDVRDMTFMTHEHGHALRLPIPANLARRGRNELNAGSEGTGIVVDSGSASRHLIGQRVAGWGGGWYSEYRTLPAAECISLSAQTTAEQAAASCVNPLTALGMVKTLQREGHSALAHTAAASTLGQMLNRLCLKDGVPLVNIVRNSDQASILLDAGATYVCDSAAANFEENLRKALRDTGATIAFDAVGGGRLAHQILSAMPGQFSVESRGDRSAAEKRVYLYGALDTGPTEVYRGYSPSWSVGGWVVQRFLQQIGHAEQEALYQRVADEITTTFATRYAASIPLTEILSESAVLDYTKRSTGGKYIVLSGDSSSTRSG
jgi:NADPH2:quinone reductase